MIRLEETVDYASVNMYALEGSDIVCKVYNEDEVVGVIGMCVGEIVYLVLIEIDDRYRRQGYAMQAMNIVKTMYKCKNIHGFSLPESIEFWNAVGVEFVDEDHETGNVAMGGGIPFILHADNV